MYEQHFGLSAKPFQLSPDADFFFPSKEHKRALSFLQYGLSQADGFIVITGNVGTGKTTLVQALLKDLDQSHLSVATLVSSNLDEEDLLKFVAGEFGLRSVASTKADLLQDLEHTFLQEARANRRVLLIVDEAQNLPPASVEELRMLSNFQSNGRPLVQIFLLGQQEFRATLLSEGFEQLRQRVIATYHLNPLNEEETQTYIEHRLSVVGWTGNPRFTDEAYRLVFEFCDGVPRRLNNLCDRLLLFAYLEDLDTIDSEVVQVVAEEIGHEFLGGTNQAVQEDEEERPAASIRQEVFDSPDQPLETVARGIFDKANVQQRLGGLERALDALGHTMKTDMQKIDEELSYVRLILEDILNEMREQKAGSQSGQPGKRGGLRPGHGRYS
jgi:putative secretion ATPase (PEP-CTERM system associated)